MGKYAIQLIDCRGITRREWRITGELYDYMLTLIAEADGLPGIFEVDPGEH